MTDACEHVIDLDVSQFSRPSPHVVLRQAACVAEQIQLDPEQQRRLGALRRGELPILHFKGLPRASEHPPTPLDGYSNGYVSEETIGMLALMKLGHFDPVCYRGENRDQLLRDVVPVRQTPELSSHGVRRFPPHTDNPHQAMGEEDGLHGPDILAFVCHRPSRSAPTMVCKLDDVLSMISMMDIRDLARPEFNVHRPDSFGGGLAKVEVPVLAWNRWSQPVSRFHANAVRGITPRARDALHRFSHAALNAPYMEFTPQPGECLMFSNHRTLHRRPRIQEGEDRWLVRAYGLADSAIRGEIRDPNAPWLMG